MTAAAQHPDCDAFGCVGLVRCDYCDGLIPGPESTAALLAAARIRRGDVLGALRLLQTVAGSADPWERHPAVEADTVRSAALRLLGKPDPQAVTW